jgi:L-amino acid N-acyltransferase YncA
MLSGARFLRRSRRRRRERQRDELGPSPAHSGFPMLRSMNLPDLVIRPAQQDDATAVAAIYAPYVNDTAVSFETEAPSVTTMARRISETLETHPWLAAERGSTVVGYAYTSRHSQWAAYRWTVDVTVYVRAQEHRSGVGRALYLVLLTMLREQGFRSAFAEIVLPNPGSVRLHEAAGFKHIGIHKDIGFKLGRWHDIGYWRLGLADGAASLRGPVPFASFRDTPAFNDALAQVK